VRPGRTSWWLRRFARACRLFVILAAAASFAFHGSMLLAVDLIVLVVSIVLAHYWVRSDERKRGISA
jgi:hypothetical protein